MPRYAARFASTARDGAPEHKIIHAPSRYVANARAIRIFERGYRYDGLEAGELVLPCDPQTERCWKVEGLTADGTIVQVWTGFSSRAADDLAFELADIYVEVCVTPPPPMEVE